MKPSPFPLPSWKGGVAKREMVLRQGKEEAQLSAYPGEGHLGPK